jgi:hypothetical protein
VRCVDTTGEERRGSSNPVRERGGVNNEEQQNELEAVLGGLTGRTQGEKQ